MTRQLPTHDVFLDFETGGLRRDDCIWEVGMVVDGPGINGQMHHYYVSDFRPSDADPMALQMNGFWQRHPLHRVKGIGSRMDPGTALTLEDHGLIEPDLDGPPAVVHGALMSEAQVAYTLESFLRNARVCVVNPAFDKPLAVSALARAGLPFTGHYTPVCIGSYAAGVLGIDPTEGRSDDIAAALGVKREDFGTGHTALVDALYGRAILRAAEAKAGLTPGWKVRANAEQGAEV